MNYLQLLSKRLVYLPNVFFVNTLLLIWYGNTYSSIAIEFYLYDYQIVAIYGRRISAAIFAFVCLFWRTKVEYMKVIITRKFQEIKVKNVTLLSGVDKLVSALPPVFLLVQNQKFNYRKITTKKLLICLPKNCMI